MAGRELDELGHLGDVLALDTLGLEHVAALTQDLDALFHLLHAHHVAVHRVAALVGDLVKLHFIVERVGVALAHIAVMAAGTSRRTSDGIVDGIFLAQDTHAHHAVACYHVASEELVVFLEFLGHSVAHVAHVLDKVGVHIGLHAANGEITHRHACAAGLVEDIIDELALTESVEERCGSALVHCQAAVAEQVARDAHELVHHHADELGTVRHLQSHGLLDAQAQAVAVDVGRHIV